MLENLIKIAFLYLPFQIALNPFAGIDLASIRIIFIAIFFIWLSSSFKNKFLFIPFNINFLFLSFFLFLNILSLLFADNHIWGSRKFIFFLNIFPLFIVIFNIFSLDSKKGLSLLRYLVFGGFFTALVGIAQFLAQFFIPLNTLYSLWAKIITPFLGNSFSEAVLTNPSWLVNIGGHTFLRATAFFPDPHMLAFYLNMTGLIALGTSFYQKKGGLFENKQYLIFSLVLFLASFLTFSRGGYLGLIAGILFFSLFALKNKTTVIFNSPKKLFFSISLFLALIIAIFIPNPISNRLLSSFNLSEGSNIGRLETWQEAFFVIKNNPLLGVGLGNYALTIKPSADYREPIYAHNTFLDIAVETGLFSTLLFISLLLYNIFCFLNSFLKKENYLHLGLASALITFFIHSLFETAIFSIHILPVFILIISLNNYLKK